MSDTRKKGLKYLEEVLGYQTSEMVAVSRLYPPEKSWTKREAWWFDLSIEKIKKNKNRYYYLLGAKDASESNFVILKVPYKYFLDNLEKFEIRYRGRIRLHLAAYRENWLVDERGKGKVPFSKFEYK